MYKWRCGYITEKQKIKLDIAKTIMRNIFREMYLESLESDYHDYKFGLDAKNDKDLAKKLICKLHTEYVYENELNDKIYNLTENLEKTTNEYNEYKTSVNDSLDDMINLIYEIEYCLDYDKLNGIRVKLARLLDIIGCL